MTRHDLMTTLGMVAVRCPDSWGMDNPHTDCDGMGTENCARCWLGALLKAPDETLDRIAQRLTAEALERQRLEVEGEETRTGERDKPRRDAAVDEWGRPFKACDNPDCDRLVKQGTMYCCSVCGQAHAGGWEIHDDGLLGHSGGCNRRHVPAAILEALPPMYGTEDNTGLRGGTPSGGANGYPEAAAGMVA